MLRFVVPGVVLASCLLAGCFGQSGALACADASRYANSSSAPPLRVPDDLSLPDESDSLSVPPPPRNRSASAAGSESAASTSAASSATAKGHCLEVPPNFGKDNGASAQAAPGDSKAGATGGQSSRKMSRRERRRSRRSDDEG